MSASCTLSPEAQHCIRELGTPEWAGRGSQGGRMAAGGNVVEEGKKLNTHVRPGAQSCAARSEQNARRCQTGPVAAQPVWDEDQSLRSALRASKTWGGHWHVGTCRFVTLTGCLFSTAAR